MRQRIHHSVSVAAIVLALMLSLPAAAGALAWDAPAFSLAPSDIAAAAADVKVPGSDDAVFLYEEDSYTFDESGAALHRYRTLYKILTRDALSQVSTASCWWQPWRQDTPKIRARVIGKDARVSLLDPKTIADNTARSHIPDVYSDSRVLDAPLPSLEPGCVVEYVIEVNDRMPLLGAGSVMRVWFGHPQAVVTRRLLIDCPSSLSLRYSVRGGLAVEPVRTEAGGRVSLRFDAANLSGVKESEPLLTTDEVPFPCIDFSTGSSWQEVARAYAAVTDPMLEAAPLGEYARSTERPGDANVSAIVAAILYRVRRDVRYTGINFGENAIIPHPPLDTLKRGYGDCKDQAVLLAAALRAAGIEARLALLLTAGAADVSPQLPGFGLFDHAIVYLPSLGMWIDPTADFYPPGELPPPDQGRRALVIAADTTSLSPTPDPSPASNWFHEVRQFTLKESGPSSVVETTTMGGSIEAWYRDSFERNSTTEAHDRLEKYVKKEYNAGALVRWSLSDPRAMDVPFTLTLEASGTTEGITDDSSAVVYVRGGGLVGFLPDFVTREDSPGSPFTRTRALRLWQPFVYEYTYQIVPPPGFRAAALPPNETVSLGPAVLTKAFQLNKDGSVTGTLRFDCVRQVYTAAETIAMHDAIRSFLSTPASVVTFEQIGESLLAAGKYRDALDEFRRLAALHPSESRHRVQISSALLAAGFGRDALEEARAAVALEPKLALPHANLAWVLVHDDFGRLFASGVDLDGARQEYKNAHQLDQSNSMYARNLAILDEYNDSLVRYGKGAMLEEAVAMYRGIEKDIKGTDYWQNLSIDLLRMGRFQEVRTTLRGSTQNRALQALFVAATAAIDGAAAAQNEAARLVPSADDRRWVLSSAAQHLLAVRRYPECAELMVAGARGTPNLTQTMAFADMLRALTPADPKLLSDKSPQGIVLMLMAALFETDSSRSDFSGLLAASMRAALSDAAGRSEMASALEGFRATISQVPLPPETLFDLMARFMSVQTVVEGGATAALVSLAGLPSETPLILYLTQEAGSFRIVDATGDLSGIARECLALIDAGRLEDARNWFQLVRLQHRKAPAFPDAATDPVFSLLPEDRAATVEGLKVAAAYCLARSRSSTNVPLGVSLLLPGWQDERVRSRSQTMETVLAEALLFSGKLKDLEPVATSYARHAPENVRALELLCLAMDASGRRAEADALVQSRLASRPEDLPLMRLRARRLAGAGAYAESIALSRTILASAAAELRDYNNFAWYLLYAGVPDPAVVEKLALVPRLMQGRAPELHTLACLLADQGRILEAQEVFGKYLQQREGQAPDSSTWLAYGILAQRFGLKDTALFAFGKTTLEASDSVYPGMSSWTLAQQHVREMRQGRN